MEIKHTVTEETFKRLQSKIVNKKYFKSNWNILVDKAPYHVWGDLELDDDTIILSSNFTEEPPKGYRFIKA